MVIAASIKYRSLIGVWAIYCVNTKEWIIKFDFRGEKGQGTSGTTTGFEGNTERTVEGYYRRDWTCAVGG